MATTTTEKNAYWMRDDKLGTTSVWRRWRMVRACTWAIDVFARTPYTFERRAIVCISFTLMNCSHLGRWMGRSAIACMPVPHNYRRGNGGKIIILIELHEWLLSTWIIMHGERRWWRSWIPTRKWKWIASSSGCWYIILYVCRIRAQANRKS